MTAIVHLKRKTPANSPKRRKGKDLLKEIKTNKIGPTPERMAKMGEHYTRGDLGIITARDAPLEALHVKKVIDGRQYDAGKKFYHHWYRAGLNERFAALNLASGIFGSDGFSMGMPTSEDQAYHRDRYRKSVQYLGLKTSTLVQHIVCSERQPAEVGRSLLGWTNDAQARAAAIERLKDALDRLAELYGL